MPRICYHPVPWQIARCVCHTLDLTPRSPLVILPKMFSAGDMRQLLISRSLACLSGSMFNQSPTPQFDRTAFTSRPSLLLWPKAINNLAWGQSLGPRPPRVQTRHPRRPHNKRLQAVGLLDPCRAREQIVPRTRRSSGLSLDQQEDP